MYRIEYGHEYQPFVSIMITACDELSALIDCVDSLLSVTAYQNYEIIITDNMSQGSEMIAWLDSIAQLSEERIRVIRMAEKFTRSQVYNRSYLEARGDYLLFLNFDTFFDDPHWLNLMLNHAQRPEVGVVGPRLFNPNQLVQYAGFILGLRSVVSRPFIKNALDSNVNHNRFLVDQNYSALPDICLMNWEVLMSWYLGIFILTLIFV
jgi:glycosyltransferase involved in cell wall biosynthesis